MVVINSGDVVMPLCDWYMVDGKWAAYHPYGPAESDIARHAPIIRDDAVNLSLLPRIHCKLVSGSQHTVMASAHRKARMASISFDRFPRGDQDVVHAVIRTPDATYDMGKGPYLSILGTTARMGMFGAGSLVYVAALTALEAARKVGENG